MRAFIALDLSEEVKARLATLLRELVEVRRSVKWCSPDQVHVTLKFLGEVPEGRLAELGAAVAPVLAAAPPFSFAVRGTGTFGPGGRVRVVWVGIDEPTGALVHLQERLEGAVAPLGYPPEGRPFKPHLTLGRLRDPVRDEALRSALEAQSSSDLGTVFVDRAILYESTLTPRGSIYRAVTTWPLGGHP